jgi:hypothetical protein
MALNKSGMPPMQRPIARALIPGGAGTVEPKKPKPLNLGSLPALKPGGKVISSFNYGGSSILSKGLSTGRMPKIPRIPMPGAPRTRGPI